MPKKILFIGENHDDPGTIFLLQELAEAALRSGKTPCILIEGYDSAAKHTKQLISHKIPAKMKDLHRAIGIKHYNGKAGSSDLKELTDRANVAFRGEKISKADLEMINRFLSSPSQTDIFLSNPDRFVANSNFIKFAESNDLDVAELESGGGGALRARAIHEGSRVLIEARPERDEKMAGVVLRKLSENDDVIVLCGASHVVGIMDNIAKAYKADSSFATVEMHAITKEVVSPSIHDAGSAAEFTSSKQTFERVCEIFKYSPSSKFAVESAYGVSAAATRAAGGGWEAEHSYRVCNNR